MVLVMLAGCAGESEEINRVMALRARLLGSEGCAFSAEITADYGDSVYTFAVHCKGDSQGNLEFQVMEPESICGISGTITAGVGALTFDDTAVEFPLLADDQVTPVSGPWIFLKTLLGGYLTSCADEGENLRATIRDSYEEEALQMDIWLNGEDMPIHGEIVYEGRRILTMEIDDFEIL